ncbi:aminopeptidase [Ectothiorhodospiraceae bacterium BW-2]|nr:aminopeptidase [Ectothiorhodospiraceae bacterium BW-2]
MRAVWFALLWAALSGCSHLGYYSQAVGGHIQLLWQRQSIEQLLQQPTLEPKQQQQLQLSQRALEFAHSELKLPDNGSYRSFVDLGSQRAVVWNVVATPADSLIPKQWCFAIVGCLSYRGYYRREAAEAYADKLRQQGLDVAVSGATAYSTLGWLSDPLLSTMINRSDADLLEVIFHELAHQQLYIADDTMFNESFATTVAQAGVEAWYRHQATALPEGYLSSRQRRQQFRALLLQIRQQLAQLYAAADPHHRSATIAQKQQLFRQLQQHYQQLKQQWQGDSGYDSWMAQPLNNAHLALVAEYHAYVPLLERVRQRSRSWEFFYQQLQPLASLDREARHKRLQQLANGS